MWNIISNRGVSEADECTVHFQKNRTPSVTMWRTSWWHHRCFKHRHTGTNACTLTRTEWANTDPHQWSIIWKMYFPPIWGNMYHVNVRRAHLLFFRNLMLNVRHCASLDPGTHGWILAVREEQTVTYFNLILNYLLYSLKPLLKWLVVRLAAPKIGFYFVLFKTLKYTSIHNVLYISIDLLMQEDYKASHRKVFFSNNIDWFHFHL